MRKLKYVKLFESYLESINESSPGLLTVKKWKDQKYGNYSGGPKGHSFTIDGAKVQPKYQPGDFVKVKGGIQTINSYGDPANKIEEDFIGLIEFIQYNDETKEFQYAIRTFVPPREAYKNEKVYPEHWSGQAQIQEEYIIEKVCDFYKDTEKLPDYVTKNKYYQKKKK